MDDPFEHKMVCLTTALDCAVPLLIIEIKQRGGPTDSDWHRAQEIGQLLGEKGDLLMFPGKKKGESAKVFNELAYGIAMLSFCPGGIKVFGRHWESKLTETNIYRSDLPILDAMGSNK